MYASVLALVLLLLQLQMLLLLLSLLLPAPARCTNGWCVTAAARLICTVTRWPLGSAASRSSTAFAGGGLLVSLRL
jgi:hypothetical protein